MTAIGIAIALGLLGILLFGIWSALNRVETIRAYGFDIMATLAIALLAGLLVKLVVLDFLATLPEYTIKRNNWGSWDAGQSSMNVIAAQELQRAEVGISEPEVEILEGVNLNFSMTLLCRYRTSIGQEHVAVLSFERNLLGNLKPPEIAELGEHEWYTSRRDGPFSYYLLEAGKGGEPDYYTEMDGFDTQYASQGDAVYYLRANITKRPWVSSIPNFIILLAALWLSLMRQRRAAGSWRLALRTEWHRGAPVFEIVHRED